MKLVAGLGSIDDYVPFAEAGAEEVFTGYVPEIWLDRFGMNTPLNRREVIYYNVQIGSMSELLILQDMVREVKVPVTLAVNAIYLTEEQCRMAEETVRSCEKAGIHRFIAADEKLVRLLASDHTVYLSGEYGELNSLLIDKMQRAGVKRIIFPRQTTTQEMESMISSHPGLEYEAFLLNEKCHFTGAYCRSLHCDALCHACRIPWKLSALKNPETKNHLDISGSKIKPEDEKDSVIQSVIAAGKDITEQTTGTEMRKSDICADEEFGVDVPGFGGCGFCSLWKWRKIGITHLKIVSRGNDTESTVRDLRCARRALEILKESERESEYIQTMKRELFPYGCSGNCYGA